MQVHGFLAQAAMLNAAAGRSAYSIATPAFSDTRPTYSRDAQDEEGAPHSDISGSVQTPHLTFPQLARPDSESSHPSCRLSTPVDPASLPAAEVKATP